MLVIVYPQIEHVSSSMDYLKAPLKLMQGTKDALEACVLPKLGLRLGLSTLN